MTDSFDRAFAFTIGAEGGYVNNPNDPGGETKYGISKAAYPGLDIAALTVDDAKAIYRRDYWQKIRGDALPAPLAMVTFDAAVNSGTVRAAEWMQGGLHVTADGMIGPETIAAASQAANGGMDAAQLAMSARLMFLSGLGQEWRTFGLGWTRRVVRLAGAIANGR